MNWVTMAAHIHDNRTVHDIGNTDVKKPCPDTTLPGTQDIQLFN